MNHRILESVRWEMTSDPQTNPSTQPYHANAHGPQCHISMLLHHLQGRWPQHSLDSCAMNPIYLRKWTEGMPGKSTSPCSLRSEEGFMGKSTEKAEIRKNSPTVNYVHVKHCPTKCQKTNTPLPTLLLPMGKWRHVKGRGQCTPYKSGEKGSESCLLLQLPTGGGWGALCTGQAADGASRLTYMAREPGPVLGRQRAAVPI